MTRCSIFILILVLLVSCAKQEDAINLAPETPIDQINLPDKLTASFQSYTNGIIDLQGECTLIYTFNEQKKLMQVQTTYTHSILENESWVPQAPIIDEINFVYENGDLIEVRGANRYNVHYYYVYDRITTSTSFNGSLVQPDIDYYLNSYNQIATSYKGQYSYDNIGNIKEGSGYDPYGKPTVTLYAYDTKKHYLSGMNSISAQAFLIQQALGQCLLGYMGWIWEVPFAANSNINNPVSVVSSYSGEREGINYTWNLEYPHHNDAGYPTQIKAVYEGIHSHWDYYKQEELPIREEYSVEITYKQVE